MESYKGLKIDDIISVTYRVIRRENNRYVVLGFYEKIPCFPIISIKKIYKGFNKPKLCKVTKLLKNGVVVTLNS